MPVYHFTLHAYDSWNADNPKGWYQHGVAGKRFPAPGVAKYRVEHARWDEVHFADSEHADLILMARDIADRRSWRTHGTQRREQTALAARCKPFWSHYL
jgi:hypothetical protein